MEKSGNFIFGAKVREKSGNLQNTEGVRYFYTSSFFVPNSYLNLKFFRAPRDILQVKLVRKVGKKVHTSWEELPSPCLF